jgi:hypothetical protein
VAALLITDYHAQRRDWQELALHTSHFIGLYGEAVKLLAQENDPLADQALRELAMHLELFCCPSAAKRRGIDSLPFGVRWLSLPMMLERIEGQTLHVLLQKDSALARTDALELCLAALALDWSVQLSVSATAIAGLMRAPAQVAAKGFASLPMFGLQHIFIDAEQAEHLADAALMLPWRVGIATPAHLVATF